jgi:probable phosphoglycerate mutase
MERNFGKYEGMELKDVDTQELWDYYINKECNEAETIQELFQRVYSFYDEILDKYPDKNILIVTHGGVSIPTHCYFNNYIPKGKLIIKEYLLDNCQVKTFTKKNI